MVDNMVTTEQQIKEEEFCEKFLLRLGIVPNKRHTIFTIETFILYCEEREKGIKNPSLTNLYRIVASTFGTTISAVERGIRYTHNRVFENVNAIEVLTCNSYLFKGDMKFTNSEFMYFMYMNYKIEERKGDK